MAKYAPTVPIQIYEAMHEKGELGDYHLLLSHDIVRDEETKRRYLRLFGDPANADKNMTIILDNSICELGNAVGVEVVAEAAKWVNATCIVLPDVYLRPHETVISCMEALETWPKHFPEGTGFMIVPQGKSMRLFTECAEAFAEQPEITWWGVPRNIVEFHGSRREAAYMCALLNVERNIHLLGFSDNIIDDALVANECWFVEGIDSAVPVRAAHHHRAFNLTMSELPPRKETDWWETGTLTELAFKNLQRARQLFSAMDPEPVFE
jgi:hypothetical protein